MSKMHCQHCDEAFEVDDANVAHVAPTHDFPKPCRQVCPGSGKRMRKAGDRTRRIREQKR